jgi:hypothetical protein
MAKKPTTNKPVPTTRAELLERFKDYPGLKAFERALDSPDGSTSLPILLKGDPPDACLDSAHQETASLGAVKCRKCGKPMRYWYVHHVNTKQPGRVARVKAQGMVPAEIDELLSPEELSDLVKDSADGLVHTGTNGVRVLYKIPLDLRNMRRRAARDARNRRNSNPKKVREDLANDAAAQYGSEAADLVYQGLEYTERAIRTTYEDEARRDLDDD